MAYEVVRQNEIERGVHGTQPNRQESEGQE